jgi:uncharacterized SAM-binding protein YcdF (DUF218 family)
VIQLQSSGTAGGGPGRVRRTARGLGRGGAAVARGVGDLRYSHGRRRMLLRALLLLLVLVVGYVGVTFVQVWAASRRDGARSADAVVVLGAAQYDGRPSPVLEGRLDHALELYEDGLVKVIVVTGGKQDGDRFTEAYVGSTYLRGKGVPEGDLRLEVQGRNTWESLAAAARILHDEDMDQAILVTDGYHALRVDAIADELGIEASVSPSRRGGTLRQLVEETGAVAVGRVLGFRRLVNIDDRFDDRISDESP